VPRRFWMAVQELKRRPLQEVASRAQEIWQEFLAPGAQSAINVDSKSYAKTTENLKDPGRYTFEDAQVSRTNVPPLFPPKKKISLLQKSTFVKKKDIFSTAFSTSPLKQKKKGKPSKVNRGSLCVWFFPCRSTSTN